VVSKKKKEKNWMDRLLLSIADKMDEFRFMFFGEEVKSDIFFAISFLFYMALWTLWKVNYYIVVNCFFNTITDITEFLFFPEERQPYEQRKCSWADKSPLFSLDDNDFDYGNFSPFESTRSPLSDEVKLRIYTCTYCQTVHFAPKGAIECCVRPILSPGSFITYNLKDVTEKFSFKDVKWVKRFGDGTKELYFIITDVETAGRYTRYSVKTLGVDNVFSSGWILKEDSNISRAFKVPTEIREKGQEFVGQKYIIPLPTGKIT